MNKEDWASACSAAIRRPLQDATNAWGAVVVSSQQQRLVAQHCCFAYVLTRALSERRVRCLRCGGGLHVHAVVAAGFARQTAHLEVLRMVHWLDLHWQLHWSCDIRCMDAVAFELL